MLIAKVRLFIIGIQLVQHGVFRKRLHDSGINKKTMDGVAVKCQFPFGGLFLEEILEPETGHEVLQEKVSNVQLRGCGSLVIRLFHPFIVISRNGIFHLANTVFLIHFPNFCFHIGKGVVSYFQKFGVFPEPFDISGRDLFAVSDSNLSIIDRIFTIFVIKEFHCITAIAKMNATIIIQRIQQIDKQNLTKKYRISAVCRTFIQLQVLKTRKKEEQ